MATRNQQWNMMARKYNVISVKWSWVIGVFLALAACTQDKEQVVLSLENTSNTNLFEKPITVSRGELPFQKDGDYFPLLLTTQGDTIPVQVDDWDGDGQWDELFFLVDIPALQQLQLTLKPINDSIAYDKRTGVRFGKRDAANSPVTPRFSDTLYAHQLPLSLGYQPYQTDGPSWENDKVGFRHYFDGRNAKDLFGKKVAYLSPSDVGISTTGAVEDNYHVMADWGQDILPVNNSVGIGGIALKAGDSLFRLGVTVGDAINNVDTTIFKIARDGSLRSTLDFQYKSWKADDRYYGVREHPEIWPGMYGYQNTVQVDGLQGDETLLIGLVNIFGSKPKEISIADEWVVLFTYDKQTYDQEWWLGLGLILPSDVYKGYIEAPDAGPLSKSYFAELAVSNTEPVTYFAVAGWELADVLFQDSDGFEEYIIDLANQLAAVVEVSIR